VDTVPVPQIKVGVHKGVLIHGKRLAKILIVNKVLTITLSDNSKSKFIVNLRVGHGVQNRDATS